MTCVTGLTVLLSDADVQHELLIGLIDGSDGSVDLRQLEHFVVLAQEMNFTKAARRLHIAQSGLSASIKKLEQDLGAELFVRTTRRVDLTDAGRALFQEARRTLASAAAARYAVQAQLRTAGGLVRLGSIPSFGGIDLPRILTGFQAMHPESELQITIDMGMHLMSALEHDTLDIAVVTLPDEIPRGIESYPISTDPVVLICRSDHRLAGRRSVRLQELENERFIDFPPEGSHARVANDRAFSDAGTSRRIASTCNDVSELLELVVHGMGVALVPSPLALPQPSLRTVPLEGVQLFWTLGALIRREGLATSAAREFARFFLESVAIDGAGEPLANARKSRQRRRVVMP